MTLSGMEEGARHRGSRTGFFLLAMRPVDTSEGMSSASATTPLMKQYWDIKSAHPDKVLLFRMGDFFEMFFDDAVTAAPIVGIALTSRNKKSGDETPMCGVPHHSIGGPINKLLAAGHKVAICDQIEDPKLAKGLVKRAVTRVLTPGMVYDLETLEEGRPHYLAAIDERALALVDTSTGEAFWVEIEGPRDLARWWGGLPIAELVLREEQAIPAVAKGVLISRHNDEAEITQTGVPAAARLLLSYVRALSGADVLGILRPFEQRRASGRMHLSPTVLRHLEIFQTYRGEGPGSLFHAVDRTKTPAGRRLWRQWLTFPLGDAVGIHERWNGVEFWRQDPARLKRLREVLFGLGDLERRFGKIPLPTCNGRDLLSLASSIEAGLRVLELAGVESVPPELGHLASAITSTLVEDPPLSTKQGYLIRQGVDADLDELIMLSTDAQSLLARMEAKEREATGISSLKIRYNNVFGYYIEITNSHKDKAPDHYRRKQTLANAERYCTDELIELEKKVLSAQTRRAELESEFFESLRRDILSAGASITTLARLTAEIDVLSSLAWLSLEQNYCRPEIAQDGALELVASRHPVVEQTVRGVFTANDIVLESKACLLLTGPNMAGKSTLMRQVALIGLLAQSGSYVPAQRAKIPLFDAVYTRIGASDQLSEGLSTFMVEMTETAQLLREATERSLVILDEVGRGTSTYDGMSLAQALLEHLLADVRCLTLFATHYHELTGLESMWPQIRNAHMSVVERSGEIRFLHSLTKGPALKSYGIQVANLAGLPPAVTKRAQQILREKEMSSAGGPSQLSLLAKSEAVAESFEDRGSALDPALSAMIAEIREVPIAQMTPLEALNRVAGWREKCRGLS